MVILGANAEGSFACEVRNAAGPGSHCTIKVSGPVAALVAETDYSYLAFGAAAVVAVFFSALCAVVMCRKAAHDSAEGGGGRNGDGNGGGGSGKYNFRGFKNATRSLTGVEKNPRHHQVLQEENGVTLYGNGLPYSDPPRPPPPPMQQGLVNGCGIKLYDSRLVGHSSGSSTGGGDGGGGTSSNHRRVTVNLSAEDNRTEVEDELDEDLRSIRLSNGSSRICEVVMGGIRAPRELWLV